MSRFEWIVPLGYGTALSCAANTTSDSHLIQAANSFDAYGTDSLTVLTVKGHICFSEANAATPEMNVFGWRVRVGLENLNVGGVDYAGSIDALGTAEESFLDERFWTQGTMGTSVTNMPPAYYLKFDIKSKRKLKRGQTLGLSFWNDADVVRRVHRFIRVGVLLHT